MGLFGSRNPARASFTAAVTCSMALSWPKTKRFRSMGRDFSAFSSSREMDFGGMRAILAITDSISLIPIFFLRFFSSTSFVRAPASSMISIALSGSMRSVM